MDKLSAKSNQKRHGCSNMKKEFSMTIRLSSITFNLPRGANSYLRSRIPLKFSKKLLKNPTVYNLFYEQKFIQGNGNVVYITISNLPYSTGINELYSYVFNVLSKFLSEKGRFSNEELSDRFTPQDFQNSTFIKIAFDFSIPMKDAVSLFDHIFKNQRFICIPYKIIIDEAHNLCAVTKDHTVISMYPNETEIAFSVEFNGIRNKISFEMYQQLSKENVIDVLNRLFLSFQTKKMMIYHIKSKT